MGSKKPDLIDVEVGQRIRIQRLAAGLSQSELAERIGVTFQQVQKYEKGMNRVGAGRLTMIARVLNVPVGSFFDGPAARRWMRIRWPTSTSIKSGFFDPMAP